jgi:hypothetical protein
MRGLLPGAVAHMKRDLFADVYRAAWGYGVDPASDTDGTPISHLPGRLVSLHEQENGTGPAVLG